MSEHGIINGEPQTETARKYVVFQALKDMAGGVTLIPLMIFDTDHEAADFQKARAGFVASIGPEDKDLLGRLGIMALGVEVRGLQTPGERSAIMLADASALAKLPRPA